MREGRARLPGARSDRIGRFDSKRVLLASRTSHRRYPAVSSETVKQKSKQLQEVEEAREAFPELRLEDSIPVLSGSATRPSQRGKRPKTLGVSGLEQIKFVCTDVDVIKLR